LAAREFEGFDMGITGTETLVEVVEFGVAARNDPGGCGDVITGLSGDFDKIYRMSETSMQG